jgi:hypothetical protein
MSNPTDAPTHAPNGARNSAPDPTAAASAPASLPVISAILATALSAAEKRAGPADVAHGVIAALRHLRATADEEAGYTMAAAIDTTVRQHLLAGGMSELRRTGRGPVFTALPPAGPGAAAAALIMESAADSCLAINAHAQDNEPLEIAVNALALQIGRHLGGEPGWEMVERELHRPVERHGGGPILPFKGVTVH